MKDSAFLQRLRLELPIWVKKGFLENTQQQAILNDIISRASKREISSTFIFAVFGALLFIAGVISFFAANWQEIPKLIKLFILFFTLWGLYFMAYIGYRSTFSSSVNWPSALAKFAPVFLFLAALFFGANIWLIAQIYNIEAFYPGGVLAWSLGVLLISILLRDSLTLGLSIVLGVLWTGLYYTVTDFKSHIHFEYLILWFLQIFFVFRLKTRVLFNLAMLGLVSWSIFSFFSGILFNVYFLQLYILLSIFLFLIGKMITLFFPTSYKEFVLSLQHWALFLSFSALYVLATPEMIQHLHFNHPILSDFYPEPYSVGLKLTVSVILINFAILIAVLWKQHIQPASILTKRSFVHFTPSFGFLIYIALNVLMLMTLLKESSLEHYGSWYSIFFNVLYFLGTLWLIQAGNFYRDSFYINLGCFFFAVGLLTRYFDTFWALLDRALFFMLGGIILIAGSYIIEKYRRFMIYRIRKSSKNTQK